MPARSRGTLQEEEEEAAREAPGCCCSAGGDSLARSLRARPLTSSSPGRRRPPGRRKADGFGDCDEEFEFEFETTLRSWSSRRCGCRWAWTTRRAATDLRVPSVAKLFSYKRERREKKTSEEEVKVEIEERKRKSISLSSSFSLFLSPHRALSLASLAASERSRAGDSQALEPKP